MATHLTSPGAVGEFRRSDLGSLGLPVRLPRPVLLNSGRIVAEGIARPAITEPGLAARVTELTGVNVDALRIPTRIFEYQLRNCDDVLVRDAESGLPLIIRRDGEVVVSFDIPATQAFQFIDSERPFYTYIPGFNIQRVPTRVRRPLSNIVEALHSRRDADLVGKYRALPLTNFEFVVLLLNTIMTVGQEGRVRVLP